MRTRLVRWIVESFVAVTLLCAAVAALTLYASLPTIDGRSALYGLAADVVVDRDAIGVPTVIAQDHLDLVRALGFVHGQDRFFQMDLLRRSAAGEMSELLGPVVLPDDRDVRLHRFRVIAQAVVERMDRSDKAVLTAYAEGVNSGLASLRSRPFEYWVLRKKPRVPPVSM